MTPINLVSKKFETLRTKKPPEQYNFEHFTAKVLVEDGMKTFRAEGICAGEIAPDFQLPQAGGGSIRLSDLRGRPVLLHFGSYT